MKKISQLGILLLGLLLTALPIQAQKNEHAIAMQKASQRFLEDKQVKILDHPWEQDDSARTELFACRGEEPIKHFLQSYMEHLDKASLHYCYSLPYKMQTMKALHLVEGQKVNGTDVWFPLYDECNTYMIVFPDKDGLVYGFILSWSDSEDGTKQGYFTQFLGYNPEFVTIVDEVDRVTMDSVRTAIKVGETVKNNPKQEIDTTYIDGKWAVSTKYHIKVLRAMDHVSDYYDDFPGLNNKIEELVNLSKKASETELASIGFALKREASRYERLLTPEEYALIWKGLYAMETKAKGCDPQIQDYFKASESILRGKVNESRYLAFTDTRRHKFLQKIGFTVTKHENGRPYFAVWGKHYTGNPELEYLDACADEDGVLRYTAEHKETNLKPGIYRLTAAGRTSNQGNTGAFIFAKADQLLLKEIPACDDRGGDIWRDAAIRVKEADEKGQQISPSDVRIALANGGMGYGWSKIVIDGIIVRDGKVTYGVSCDKDFTGRQFTGRWLSAVDFKLERVGELPANEQ